jgi:hypothetical protein
VFEHAAASARRDYWTRTKKPERRRVKVVEVGVGDQDRVGLPELL